MPTGTLYYVLREGSTREEQWTWQEIEDLCRSGELSASVRIFLPDEDRWAALGETRFADCLPGASPGAADGAVVDDEHARIETEYKTALERLAESPDELEAHLDAGVLAGQLGRREEARGHFQTVLHRYPYHARAAQEVKRRFSKAEQKVFRYLDRPAPVWEDLAELATMPLARSPLYVVIPAAVLAGLSWVPGGAIIGSVLVWLWLFQIMEYTARGATRPADWNRAFADPWRKLVRPVLLMSAVVVQWGIVIVGGTKLSMMVQGRGGESLWEFLGRSPVAIVAASIVAAIYLPAAMVSIGGFTGSVAKTLDPRRLVRTIIRMEHEYIYSVALIAAIGLPVAVVRGVVGGIPVAGNIVAAAALAYAAPMWGLVLGRLLGRMGHVIE
jgi:hypothetical protein